MTRILLLAATASVAVLGTMGAFAEARDVNPMGFDFGPFHPAIPAQVTTYYPPEPTPVVPRKQHRVRRP